GVEDTRGLAVGDADDDIGAVGNVLEDGLGRQAAPGEIHPSTRFRSATTYARSSLPKGDATSSSPGFRSPLMRCRPSASPSAVKRGPRPLKKKPSASAIAHSSGVLPCASGR